MCYQAQEFLARGYFTMIMKCGEFQYYYNMWFESSTGQPLPIRSAFNWDPKKPLTQTFYRFLKAKMEQDYGPGVQCYELYALYLNFIPIQMVESHSKELVSRLFH